MKINKLIKNTRLDIKKQGYKGIFLIVPPENISDSSVIKLDIGKNVIKNGFIGKLVKRKPIIYCNEKDKKRRKFLFKCCKGCKHNPF